MTPAQEQPIWVQDLMAWLEKIQAQNLKGEQSAAQLEELLAELPGQGLPEEYWVKAKESAEAMSSDQSVELEPESLSDEDRDRIYQELERAREIEEEYERWQALVAVAAQISASESQLLEAALDAAKTIKQEFCRAKVLAAVAAQIPASELQLLEAALDAAKAIENKDYRSQALAAVVPQLPASERQSVLQAALEAAKAIEHGRDRSPVLITVAAHIPTSEPQLLEAALDAAKAIENEMYRGDALAAVAAKFPASERQSVLEATLDAAKAIKSEYYRVEALAAVAAQLPASERQSVLKAALEVTKAIENEMYRGEALAAIAAHIPTSEPQLLQTVLEVTKAIEKEKYRSQVLAAIAAHIPTSEPQLLQTVLEVTKAIEKEEYRSQVLAAIATQISPSEPQLPEAALDNAFKIEDKNQRIDALSDIAFQYTEFLLLHSPPSQTSTILEIIPKGKTSADKAKLLSALAPRLSSGLFPRALLLIQTEITHPAYQAEALSNLAPYLPTEQLSEALTLVNKHIVGYSDPTTALCNLIPRLTVEQINQAFKIATTRIPQPDLLTKVCQAIAIRLNAINSLQEKADDGNRNELIQTILDHIKKPLFNEKSITAIITALAPSLNFDEPLKELLTKIESDYNRTQVIAAISPHLSEENLHNFLRQAEALRQERPKAKALSALIAAYPEDLPESLVQSVSKLQESPSNPILDTEIALIFATRPHPKNQAHLAKLTRDQSQALRLIRDQSRDNDKANYLIQLAPHLLNSQAIEAQSIAQDIQDAYHRARSLVALATRFPQVRADAQRQIKQVETKSDIQHIELLCQFATILPETISTLLKTIEDWDSPKPLDEESDENREQVTDPNRRNYKRTLILKAIKPHLPIRLSREIDRQTRIGKAPQDLWERSLFVLRNEYRQALKSGSLRNDAAQDEDLLDLKDEINALTEMLLMRDLTPPVAVGILVGWGGGKSYIMHLMQRHMVEIRSRGMDKIEAWGLKDEKSSSPDSDRVNRYVGHIYQIKFDAWTYAKSNLWSSLMQTIFFELDRQINLETSLLTLLNPLEENGGKIWQVLYKSNEDDRQYFLEKVLGKEKLEQFKKNGTDQKESWTELLWQQYGVTETEASIHLNNIKKELDDVQAQLKIKNIYKQEILDGITNQKKPKNWVSEVFAETADISAFLLKRYFDKDVAKDLQQEITARINANKELAKLEKVDPSTLKKMNEVINQTVAEILEEDQITINGKKHYSLSWSALKKWLKRNQRLIITFLLL